MATSGQSPVDIPAGAPIHPADIEFHYRPGPVVVVDDLWAVRVDWPPGSTAIIDGNHCELLQFHVHHPAEHSFEGDLADAELHLVHQSPGGLAVVAVMLTKGEPCAALEPMLMAMGGLDPGPFDPSELLPTDRRYVAYEGSLTVPPYTEGVSWRVMPRPIQAGDRQLAAFARAYPGNSRPTQPLGKRTFT